MSKDKLTLRECKREDLIWIIKRILQMTALHNENYYLNKALNELWYKKAKKRIDEADGVAQLADAKFREYIEVMKPYEGIPLLDIPVDIIKKAQGLLEEHNRLEKRWNHLIGLKGSK